MAFKAENLCAGDAEASEMVLLPSATTSDNNHTVLRLQVSRLTRRAALTAAMAATLAPLVFGETR
jgi:hypothetical protein